MCYHHRIPPAIGGVPTHIPPVPAPSSLRLVMPREVVGRRDLLLPPGGPGGSPKIPDSQAPEGAQRPSGEAGVLLPKRALTLRSAGGLLG